MATGTLGFNVAGESTPTDGKTSGSTKIQNGPSSGMHLSPVLLTFETIEANAITETAIVSIGTNSPNFDNIMPAYGIKPVEGAVETVVLPSSKIINSGAGDIYVRVVRAASGTALRFVAGIGYVGYTTT